MLIDCFSLAVLHADNDSTTMARLDIDFPDEIEKKDDQNHLKKGLTSSLYDLAKR